MFFFSFYNESYIALIGDIVGSKKISDRNAIQLKLKRKMDEINRIYDNDLESNFTITLGDEFQALFKNGKNVLKIIKEIENEVYPVKIRFGLGIGEMSTEIEKFHAIGSDGPAYYKARESIEYLKNNEGKKYSEKSNIKISFDADENNIQIKTINVLFSLINVIEKSWTDRQREIVFEKLYSNQTQQEIATKLNIKQPSVSESLNNANFTTYKELIKVIESILGEVVHNGI